MALAVGGRFTMKADAEPFELRDPKKSRLIARYLPGQSYGVTGKNLEAVTLLIAQGKAVEGYVAPAEGGA